MGGHMLPAAGDLMVAVHSMWSRQSGDLRHGSGGASDDEVLARGCEGAACTSAPDRMDMSMLMLELMGAPAPWLNVMFMAPFVAMDMELRPLEGAAPDIHASHDHTTGGVGDLSATALVRLFESEGQHLHAGLGLGVPTGDVDLRFRRTHQESRGYVHYGMQLGSGTWDFLPSLTYTGSWQRWSWGGQVSGAVRLEDANRSGYALGDLVQATAWGSRSLTSWLSVSLRALFAAQAGIDGSYEGLHSTAGPMDFPGSYGGRYWDLGLGLGLVVPHGYLAGNRLRVEWLQPLAEHVRGYQLERTGSLFAVWSVEF
jgi:hypothetical protein